MNTQEKHTTEPRQQSETGAPGRNGGQQMQTSASAQKQEEVRSSSLQGRSDLANRLATNPLESMWHLSREMDRLVSSVFGGSFAPLFNSPWRSREFSGGSSIWAPRIDVEQREDSLVVSADLPGVQKDDVQIEISEEGLTLSGQRREERESGSTEAGYRSVERNYGQFYRTIPLPDVVNREKLKATMRDGVLKITIPFDERAKPRRIQIEE
jgi:HSP20 family protein